MKTAHKIALFVSVVALCATLAVGVEAAKKPTAKAVKKAIVQVIKKSQTTKKAVVLPVKKQPALKVKTPTTTVKTVTTTPIAITTPAKTTSTTATPSAPAPTAPVTSAAGTYPWHNDVLATQFYIGENGVNGTTAWDCQAVPHYGGIDSPFGRNGYLPTFTPKENPFYLALPYTDIGDDAAHKKDIPWYNAAVDTGENYSFLKNTWVQVTRGTNVCYGQYEDTLTPDILDASGKRIGYGPSNHFDYVFGTAPATQPGIDISPALSDCLGMRDPNDKEFGHADGNVSWRFVPASTVPAGAWKNVITATPVSWDNCK